MKKELTVFFICSYLVSWLLWLPLILGNGGLGFLPLRLPLIYVSVGTIGPTAAALITRKVLSGDWRAFRLWSSFRQIIPGMLAGSLPLLLACFIAAAWTTRSGYSLWNRAALTQIVTLFVPNLGGGPLAEEPGWRGFALPRLQSISNPLIASVILGFLWASWHLPLFIVHFSSIPYWQYAPLMIAASVIIAFGWNVSGESTVVAICLHGLLNVGIGVILNDFVGKAEIRKFPSQGAVLVMSFLAVATLVASLTRGRLGKPAVSSHGGRAQEQITTAACPIIEPPA